MTTQSNESIVVTDTALLGLESLFHEEIVDHIYGPDEEKAALLSGSSKVMARCGELIDFSPEDENVSFSDLGLYETALTCPRCARLFNRDLRQALS